MLCNTRNAITLFEGDSIFLEMQYCGGDIFSTDISGALRDVLTGNIVENFTIEKTEPEIGKFIAYIKDTSAIQHGQYFANFTLTTSGFSDTTKKLLIEIQKRY